MSVPVPAPVLEAMREWAGRQVALVDYSAASEVLVRSFVEARYPGGVSAFLRDQDGGADARA